MRAPVLSVLAGLVTVVWVVWLVSLPSSARPAGVPSVTSTVPTTVAATVPQSPRAEPSLAGSAPDGEVVRERPPREGASTSDVVTALAGVLALSESEAVAWAEANGYLWRVTWRDGEAYAYSFDYVPDRLNLEIADGIVTFAWFG